MSEVTTLYYLSKQPIGLVVPSTPKSDFENQTIPHICFSTSIQGCLMSLNENKNLIGERFHVYYLDTDDYCKPSLAEVPNRDITGEVWVQYACEPEYLYDIEIVNQKGEQVVEINGNWLRLPIWEMEVLNKGKLTEDTRVALVSKSRGAGPYKNQMRGKNRFERKKHSQIAKTVKQYNKIDMNQLFKQDILQVTVPVTGETDNYSVQIKMEGVIKEIARNIKNNKNKLEFRTIIQALTKIFNSSNIFVKCTCADYKYRFAHWNIVNNVSVDDTSKDPGPGRGIVNPKDDKGRGCKHILLVLANGDWLMKVASVINNYIHYAEKHLQKPFLNLIFPKLYGVPFDEATENNILPEDFELKSSTDIIDVINDFGRNRGKYKPGTNKNPVTGTGGKQKTTKPADSKTAPETENDTAQEKPDEQQEPESKEGTK